MRSSTRSVPCSFSTQLLGLVCVDFHKLLELCKFQKPQSLLVGSTNTMRSCYSLPAVISIRTSLGIPVTTEHDCILLWSSLNYTAQSVVEIINPFPSVIRCRSIGLDCCEIERLSIYLQWHKPVIQYRLVFKDSRASTFVNYKSYSVSATCFMTTEDNWPSSVTILSSLLRFISVISFHSPVPHAFQLLQQCRHSLKIKFLCQSVCF